MRKVKTTKQILGSILLIVFSILFLLCYFSANSKQSLLITNCSLPCWNGITPGKTNKDELMKILESLSSVDKKSITERGPSLGIFDTNLYFVINTWPGIFPKAKVVARFRRDTIIALDFYRGSLDANFGEMINLTGKPDWVLTVGTMYGTPLIRVINETKGVAFGYTMNNEKNITPETKTDFVLLFDPIQYEAMLDSGIFTDGSFDSKQIKKIIFPWDGYGVLDEKYPLRTPDN